MTLTLTQTVVCEPPGTGRRLLRRRATLAWLVIAIAVAVLAMSRPAVVPEPPANFLEASDNGAAAQWQEKPALAPPAYVVEAAGANLVAQWQGEPAFPPLAPLAGRISGVNITFYDCSGQGFCGAMFDGRRVYEGAAACSWNLALGTRFVIDGDPTFRVYTCEDRGLLADTWVDIFWYHPIDGIGWQSNVGRFGTIEILER